MSHWLNQDPPRPRWSPANVVAVVVCFFFLAGCGRNDATTSSTSPSNGSTRGQMTARPEPAGPAPTDVARRESSSGEALSPPPQAPSASQAFAFPSAKASAVASPVAIARWQQTALADQACADCHAELVEAYQAHSMGRSLEEYAIDAPPAEAGSAADESTRVIADFEAAGFHYEIQQRGAVMVHVQTRLGAGHQQLAPISEPVAFAIGSGGRGRSYLINHDGFLFLSPATYYPQKNEWHLSPGFAKNNSQFNRPVTAACLFCHADRAVPDPDSLNRYHTPPFVGHAISCQRCHGSGEMHVRIQRGIASPSDAAADTAQDGSPIINPGRLAPELREAVCQQCHLSGVVRVPKYGKTWSDFQPGGGLDQAFTAFVRSSAEGVENEDFVGQVEQMYASRCFQASQGALGCISCHDPHNMPDASARVAYYRSRCLNCHEQHPCALPLPERLAESDNCVKCHMPAQATEVQHAATSNHRVIRRLEPLSGGGDHRSPARTADKVQKTSARPLVRFGGAGGRENSAAEERDYALAVVMLAGSDDTLIQPTHVDEAQRILATWIRKNPDDIDALEALAQASAGSGELEAALRFLSDALRQRPNREFATVIAADLLGQIGEAGQAAAAWNHAVQLNPWMTRYWYQLAVAQARLGNWAACQQVAQQAAQRFPTSIGAKHLWVESLLRLGRVEQARQVFREIEAYQPPELERLQTWFRQHPANRGP